MKKAPIIISSILLLGIVTSSLVFSHRGFKDLTKLSRLLSEGQTRVTRLEEENKKLKRQLDLFANPEVDVLESQIRRELGWVKPGEIVFFESSINR